MRIQLDPGGTYRPLPTNFKAPHSNQPGHIFFTAFIDLQAVNTVQQTPN
jgi:hypothetical protein